MKTKIRCVLLLIVYFIVENFFLLVKRRENFGGDVKIMHISDVHKSQKGRDNSRISEAARKEKPDMIFITGDLVSRKSTDFSSARILLENLCSVAPVFVIAGNHEQSMPPEAASGFMEMISRTDAIFLVNEKRDVTIRGRKFRICGVQQDYSTYKKDGGYRNLDRFTAADMRRIMGECDGKNVLLLAHNPLWADVYADWGADYTFSGHVHGGAVRLFGIGILSPERKFFPPYSKGVYKVGRMKMCVSGGTGKLRLFNPPEVIFYTL